VHPVVRTLEDGRRGLFVNEGFTSRIIELKPKESEALLAFLFAHIAKPEFTVRWRWKLGDVEPLATVTLASAALFMLGIYVGSADRLQRRQRLEQAAEMLGW
jgi:Taurine catabolism dioxygenase TauD, TfdA family